jgi:hypothetical protein
VRRAPSADRQGTGALAFKCPPLPLLNAWTRKVVSVVMELAFPVQDTAFGGPAQHDGFRCYPVENIARNHQPALESITRLILTNSELNTHVWNRGEDLDLQHSRRHAAISMPN